MANATIIDVAEHADISIKTVSRVINNVKSVKPQIRERVDHAAVMSRYHGYLDGLRSCGLRLDKALVARGYNSHASGVQCSRSGTRPARRRTGFD